MPHSAMLWTGGKDSALALHESQRAGHTIAALVTFAPPNPDFKAHPLPILKLQSDALRLPHKIVPITDPYEQSYEQALARLRDELAIDTLITGDIDLVNGQPNWISERAVPTGLKVHMPLWHRDCLTLMQQLIDQRFTIFFSAVQTKILPARWVGRTLTQDSLRELQSIRETNGLDLAGENGEFHTLTLAAPNFSQPIHLPPHTTQFTDSLAHAYFLSPSICRR